MLLRLTPSVQLQNYKNYTAGLETLGRAINRPRQFLKNLFARAIYRSRAKYSLKGLGCHPCGFLKKVSSNERVEPWSFFVTFNTIISQIFPENVIQIPQVVQEIMKNLCQY